MSLGKRQEVKKAGVVVRYIEHVALGGLWRAVPFGVSPYLPPMFGMKGDTLEFVRKYGRGKDGGCEQTNKNNGAPGTGFRAA